MYKPKGKRVYSARRKLTEHFICMWLSALIAFLILSILFKHMTITTTTPTTTSMEPTSSDSIAEEVAVPNEEEVLVYFYDVPVSDHLQTIVYEYCHAYALDPRIIYAIMYVESGYQTDAVNGKHVGLMQVNKEYIPTLLEDVERSLYEYEDQKVIAGIKAFVYWQDRETDNNKKLISALEGYFNGNVYKRTVDSGELYEYKYSSKVLQKAMQINPR